MSIICGSETIYKHIKRDNIEIEFALGSAGTLEVFDILDVIEFESNLSQCPVYKYSLVQEDGSSSITSTKITLLNELISIDQPKLQV